MKNSTLIAGLALAMAALIQISPAYAEPVKLTKEQVLNEIVGKIVVQPGFGEYAFQRHRYSFADCKNNKAVVRGSWSHGISKKGKITGGNNQYTFYKDGNQYFYTAQKSSNKKRYNVKIVSRTEFSCVGN